MDVSDPGKRRFVAGVALAWGPLVPTVIGLGYAFRGVWTTKATGIAVVAGGIGESLILWGLLSMIVCQSAAMVWLVQSISRERVMRSMVSAASMCASAVILLLMGVFVWLAWFHSQ